MWHNQVVQWSLGLTLKHHRKQISGITRANDSKNTSTSREFPPQRHHSFKFCTKSHNSFLLTSTSTQSKPPIDAEWHEESLQCSSHFSETATVQLNITTTWEFAMQNCTLLIWIQCKLTRIQKVTAKARRWLLDEATRNQPPSSSNLCGSAANWASDWYLEALDSFVRVPQEQRDRDKPARRAQVPSAEEARLERWNQVATSGLARSKSPEIHEH